MRIERSAFATIPAVQNGLLLKDATFVVTSSRRELLGIMALEAVGGR
jgi:hypothetical protein